VFRKGAEHGTRGARAPHEISGREEMDQPLEETSAAVLFRRIGGSIDRRTLARARLQDPAVNFIHVVPLLLLLYAARTLVMENEIRGSAFGALKDFHFFQPGKFVIGVLARKLLPRGIWTRRRKRRAAAQENYDEKRETTPQHMARFHLVIEPPTAALANGETDEGIAAGAEGNSSAPSANGRPEHSVLHAHD
jgi:hypothetical protein